MTNPTITCDRFADRLSDLLERDVDEFTRAQLEAHALSCSDCGPLLADLRKLRIDAANLPELTPSRDLWAGISERIQTPVVEITAGGRLDGRMIAQKRRVSSPVWMGLAAAGLVAITATVTHQITKRSFDVAPAARQVAVAPTPTATTVPSQAVTQPIVDSTASGTAGRTVTSPPTNASTSLASNRLTAEQTYDDEISRLRAVVTRRKSQLDSATIAVIEHNLKVIDQAIAQCKQALRKDPHSQFLMESLNGALDDKVQLLRTAAMLPSRT